MKFSGRCLGVLLAAIATASAQVTVEVTQDHDQFLPGESLRVAVRITNLSGQALHLGGEENWLTFGLESREGTVVPKLGEAPVLGEFVLESSKVAIKRVDLAPYFMVGERGNYQIVATVRVHDWNREITSEPKSFDVIQGVKLWEQEVGVPREAGAANADPEIRRYTLLQANYHRGQIRLYLRLTDLYGKPIRVFPIGPMVSFAHPEPQIDKASDLHVLYQDGPTSFNYIVCDLLGQVIIHQTFDYVDSRPRLRADDEGNVSVLGGVRRIMADDVPAAKPADSDAPAPFLPPTTNGPAATNQLGLSKPSR